MGSADYLKWGDWNIECDRCGFKKKGSQCRHDGYKPTLFVCSKCWLPPHPQDRITGFTDDQSVPVSRPPRSPDRFEE